MSGFDINCQRCPRLAGELARIRIEYPEYHARPVPSFGVAEPRLFIVGLAPGMHGANRTGRPFTGDEAGILLYQALYEFGFSNQPVATAINDGLRLRGCRISNAVKCLPPKNSPIASEIANCNQFLRYELDRLTSGVVILALGIIAHKAIVKARDLAQKDYPFKHGGVVALPGDLWLLDSYHCSGYNTRTRRLTKEAFFAVFAKSIELINGTDI